MRSPRRLRRRTRSRAANPPPPGFVDISGRKLDTISANDLSFYEELNEAVQNERSDWVEPDIAGLFASIGIRKGQRFAPDARMRAIPTDAVIVRDQPGRYRDGARTYKVALPGPIPAKNFRSFAVYDNQTRSLLPTDQKLAGLDCTLPGIRTDADGGAAGDQMVPAGRPDRSDREEKRMKRSRLFLGAAMAASLAAAAAPALLPRPALAQANPTLENIVPEAAAVSFVAKIRSVDPATREIVMVGRSGTPVTVVAGPAVRLGMLKAGDIVSVKYYRSVAFLISAPESSGGAPPPPASMKAVLARPTEAPGGVGVRVTKVTGLVVGIDLAAHSVDLVAPGGGGVYTVEVTDPARAAHLSQLHVGDAVTAVVSEALAVTVTPAPKSWF